MSFDRRMLREQRLLQASSVKAQSPNGVLSPTEANGTLASHSYGTINKKNSDLDSLFPERNQHQQHMQKDGSDSPTFYSESADKELGVSKSDTTSMASEGDDTSGLLNKEGVFWVCMCVCVCVCMSVCVCVCV